MSKKDALISTAKELLWRKGFESMSPGLVLKESGAGQGSLYHHFTGKEALALEALKQVEAELCQRAKDLLIQEGSPMSRLNKFLAMERPATLGCRIGRLVNEESVLESSLKKPIQSYFQSLEALLIKVLLEAKDAEELRDDVDETALARLIISTIQGGYVLARANRDDGMMNSAVSALLNCLDLLRPEKLTI